MARKFSAIIFDLDDTLLDTLGQLVKPALQEACQAMIKSGLRSDIESCVGLREDFRQAGKRGSYFQFVTEHFGVKNGTEASAVTAAGEKAFHRREIKEKIQLFPEALEVLRRLKPNHQLYLITIGDPDTQKAKVKKLALERQFDDIVFVDGSKEDKKEAFQAILEKTKLEPRQVLSVGNRLDTDIRFAKELGMAGVLMEHGEYLHLKPETEFERPDFRIHNLEELLLWLQQ